MSNPKMPNDGPAGFPICKACGRTVARVGAEGLCTLGCDEAYDLALAHAARRAREMAAEHDDERRAAYVDGSALAVTRHDAARDALLALAAELEGA